MCVQTVSLIAAAIEHENIPTICLSLLREVSTVIRPPRSLFVPYPMGYPLGEPNNAELQTRIIKAGLNLLYRTDVPVIEHWDRPHPAGETSQKE
jgi:hypothetical protein